MSPALLRKALQELGSRVAQRGVKLFGGEPLLRPDLVLEAVAASRRLGGPLELCTNGALLDRCLCSVLSRCPEVEVRLSSLSPWIPLLPNVSLNFLIPPGEPAPAALRRFGEAARLGLRRFNFLPAYFVSWKPEQLSELGRTFAGLGRMIQGLRRSGMALRIENLGRWGRVPLYNEGTVVDTDGRVYASNLVLARWVQDPGRLLLGDLRRPGLIRALAQEELGEALRGCLGPRRALAFEADRALTGFVRSLEACP